jgi:hypothetical protein
MLPKEGYVSVLDPSCGSGSFLRATIDYFRKANPGQKPKQQLEAILEHVVGIDIQPLAATISRATYVLALGDLAKQAKRPFTIPVYLADSLFLPTEVKQHRLGKKPSYKVEFGDRVVEIPESLVTNSDLFDVAISACTNVAEDHAKDRRESKPRLAKFLDQETDLLKDHPDREDILDSLWQFTDELATLIRKRENSIWGFIVRNSYKPGMFKSQFDIVLGNPPWLTYHFISDPGYQAEIKKRAIHDYAIAPEHQKLFTHMELATVFLATQLCGLGKTPRSWRSSCREASCRRTNTPNCERGATTVRSSFAGIGTCTLSNLSSISPLVSCSSRAAKHAAMYKTSSQQSNGQENYLRATFRGVSQGTTCSREKQ